jgi:hypothetical protein
MPGLDQSQLAKRIREALDYDPATGVFTWKTRHSQMKAGQRAGYQMPTGYREIRVGGERYYEHRLAWLYVHGRWPKEQIDHINHKRDDNRLENLRDCSHAENHQNLPMKRSNRSGFIGVSRDERRGMWKAQITVNYSNRFLGRFPTPEEAHAAYLDAKRKLHPSYAELKAA